MAFDINDVIAVKVHDKLITDAVIIDYKKGARRQYRIRYADWPMGAPFGFSNHVHFLWVRLSDIITTKTKKRKG